MVAIRHTACNEQQRTTMILLCEDGSLRIYMANVENTSYWLQPSLQPSSVISIMKPVRKRKTATISKAPEPHGHGLSSAPHSERVGPVLVRTGFPAFVLDEVRGQS